MKASQTRRPLNHLGTEKAESPFFGKQQEKTRGDGFFQAKAIDGHQDNAMEQEADQVASAIVNHQASALTSSQRMGKQSVQKKGDEEKKDEKTVQKKDGKKEEEDKKVQKKGEDEKKEKDTQMKGEGEEEKDKKNVQKKEEAAEKEDKDAAPPKEEPKGAVEKTEGKPTESNEKKFERLLHESKGAGTPLPAKTRAGLEQKMQASFSEVRIHTGDEAITLCNLSKAQAFTHGNDIYFNANKFDPESTVGMQLLAHELTHVVQQNGPKK